MTKTLQYDVAVVGASIAGCTSAILLAQRGWKVALLERSPDPEHYKKCCTHFVQSVGMPAMRKIGLADRFEELGAIRGELEVLTEWGWIRAADAGRVPCGYNIRRIVLDPMLKDLASQTPGVSLFAGASVDGLLHDDAGRVQGVAAAWEGRAEIRAPLVVAADGANSKIAALAGLQPRRHENGRFSYYGYFPRVEFGGVRSADGCIANSRFWHLSDRLAYAFHNADNTTLFGMFLPKSEARRFKQNPLAEFHRFWKELPQSPPLGDAQPIGGLRGMMEMPNQRRPSAAPGIALVGDAAMQTDPMWAAGCGFAFASAEWLAEAVGPTLEKRNREKAIDRALKSYRRTHLAKTRGHFWHISGFSKIRQADLFERLVFSAAVHDGQLSERILTFLSRTVGLTQFASPSTVARALYVHAKRIVGSALARRRLSLPVIASTGTGPVGRPAQSTLSV